ncbi:RNA-directed DNA polymerase from mobile element jockey-like [Brachionus plicatilis]|uniref:RNA-directed DNA polymerase from mobile element jockey-like n=1 Tax=Brachionus plicatilis TaxID=10195 RepID=A0A3M7QQT3_BRAPC|nr:RNA-directed DNA polymerase from mobile element jockey-like [Brachionus plicatilis]
MHSNPNLNRLIIVQWNCFKLTSVRIELLKNFLSEKKPDIVLLNDTKFSKENANFWLRFEKYNTVHRSRELRPNNGGGICILIKECINFSHVSAFEYLKLESINIEIECGGKKKILISNYFNPPNMELSSEYFPKIGEYSKDYINPTFNQFRKEPGKNYSEILDLLIGSPSLANCIQEFKVLEDNLTSDQYPIWATFDLRMNKCDYINQIIPRFKYDLADWNLFRVKLNCKPNELTKNNVEELSLFVVTSIINAAESSIPKRLIFSGLVSYLTL